MLGHPTRFDVAGRRNLRGRVAGLVVDLREDRADSTPPPAARRCRATRVLPLRILKDRSLSASSPSDLHGRPRWARLATSEEPRPKKLHDVPKTLTNSPRPIRVLDFEPILLLLHGAFDLLR